MSLADPFGLFGFDDSRVFSGNGQSSLWGGLRQIKAVRGHQAEREAIRHEPADLGWQEAYRSLWGEDSGAGPDKDAPAAERRVLRFF